jgi:SAM-dependent methyltransferase
MRFFAENYDLLYGDKDYTRDIAAFITLAKSKRNHRVLEIGAGTGNHTTLLAPLVSHVTALERDDDFLALCQKKLGADATITFGKEFSEAEGVYDNAAAFFHVLNYIHDERDMREFLSNVAQRLKPGSVFVFDVWHAEAVLQDPPREELRTKHIRGHLIEQNITPGLDALTQRVTLDYDCAITPPTGKAVRFTEKLNLRLWPRSVLEKLLTETGFARGEWRSYKNFPDNCAANDWRIWGAFAKK